MKLKFTTAVLTLACASSAFGAKRIIVVPQRRVIVVVQPRYYSAAGLVGGAIGSAIAQWMINRQNRAAYGPGYGCDPFFASGCHALVPVAPAAATNGPGNALLPGQCPGIAPCPAGQ